MSRKNLDTLINKWISRKLFVFLVASGLLMFADLESSDWAMIAITYLGSQTVLDSVVAYNKSKNNNDGTGQGV
jgi:hypothetical protein